MEVKISVALNDNDEQEKGMILALCDLISRKVSGQAVTGQQAQPATAIKPPVKRSGRSKTELPPAEPAKYVQAPAPEAPEQPLRAAHETSAPDDQAASENAPEARSEGQTAIAEATPQPQPSGADTTEEETELDYTKDIRPLVIKLVHVTSQEFVLNFLKTKFGISSAIHLKKEDYRAAKIMLEEAIAMNTTGE